MTDIPAKLVKQLRDKTGAGYIQCKKALLASEADLDKAAQWLKEKGESVAASKSSRAAAEGCVVFGRAGDTVAVLEVNCETDSVARLDEFQKFTENLLTAILTQHPASLEALMSLSGEQGDFESVRQAMVGRIGENIQVRRFQFFEGQADHYGDYIHGGKLLGLVKLSQADEQVAHDMAMQVVACQPAYISIEDVPESIRTEEKARIEQSIKDSNKPAEIKAKIIEGKLYKQLAADALLEQNFFKDDQVKVGQYLEKHETSIESMLLWRCGEGIEKKETDFVAEVQQQAATFNG